jgi:four helix bundle protein
MNPEEMKKRTKEYAKEIIKFCRILPKNQESRLLSNQLFRAGTSVAANYRAACRARSRADFISKMGIVEEEADESLFWLELIQELELCKNTVIPQLLKEGNEILAIVVSSINTARKNK